MNASFLRRHAVAPLAALVLAAACSPDKSPDASSAEAGGASYARTCALCHGGRGEGYAADNATALNNPTFLATASDEFLRRSIARGRPGTTMSAWDRAHGGPYADADLQGLAAFVRSWQTTPTIALATAPIAGDVSRAAPVYAARCASCHGATGTEGPNVRLANAEFLALASDEFLRHAIVHGRPGTAMKPFEAELKVEEIGDVVALLRSWARPIATGDAPIPGSLGPVVLNANGPEPSFVVGNRFTQADTIHAELARGAAMGFLDARAPSDYVAGHITGANDVPFYEAADHLFALPKDKWLVSYCACPHAESGRLADTLLANGFTKVTILDEGFFVWRDRGYPVTTGPNP
ncbi:MAG TPA: c-type cytochrome [Labilithrix sp.]|nr:c-type cytochrome [Labilithrix sp.]